MSVLRAVNRELRQIAQRDRDLARGALAESAKALARRIDDPETTASAAASCVARLREVMNRIYELDPVVPDKPAEEAEEVSVVDDLTARRAARIAAAPHSPPAA